MLTVLVMNPKGGCGKSTIVTNIAGYFATVGKKVTIADCDPQHSCSAWLASRPEKAAKIRLSLPKARRLRVSRTQTDVLIIDTPAGIAPGAAAGYLKNADCLLIPVLPSPLDIHAAQQFMRRLDHALTDKTRVPRILTIANRVREDTLAAIRLEFFLENLSLSHCKAPRLITLLRQSQHYIRTAERGLSLFEIAPAATCYDREQWMPLLNTLSRLSH